MELKGNGFTLREWRSVDVQSLQQQANNINISRFLFDRFPHPYTVADAEKFVSGHQNQYRLTNFVIAVNGSLAGVIEFKPGEDVYSKRAQLGYWLGEDFWGRGIMTEAIKLITGYTFEHFDLVRIQATVNSNNLASMRVLEKAGFVKEGILKNGIVKYGEVMDEHLYALLK
jgi:RimJ/RimL family protein N-acetyltransferase